MAQTKAERKAQRQKYRKAHDEELKAKQKEYDLTHKTERKIYNQKNREKRLLTSYKYIDKLKGLDCDLTIDWLKENITSKPCIYCGETENIGCDRKDNTKGHTKENCVPADCGCNETRMDNYSFEEMLTEMGPAIRRVKEQRRLNSSLIVFG